MDMEDLQKLMGDMIVTHNELLAAHRDTEHHVIRMMERQSDLEAMAGRIEALTRQVAENNIRLSRIVEVHDYDIDGPDARLKRLEDRHRGGSVQ
jgi:hypothetical protein